MLKAKSITENYAFSIQKLETNLGKDFAMIKESTQSILEIFNISFALESKLDQEQRSRLEKQRYAKYDSIKELMNSKEAVDRLD